jgi:hypothetical protein
MDAVKNYENGDPSREGPVTTPVEPQTLTFAQLQALIESGQLDQIPNNNKISEELNVRTSLVVLLRF